VGEGGGLWDRHLSRPSSYHLPHLKGTKLMAAFSQPLDRLPCRPFLIIHVLPVPHPQWPPIQQRPFLAALTIVNLHLEMHMCACANLCKRYMCAFFLQIFASCICISRTCASPESFYRCVCICMLPATLLNVMGHSPLQLWGSSAQIVPSTSESSA